MSGDYFGDASDADFLALAQQLDSRENRNAIGNRSASSTGRGRSSGLAATRSSTASKRAEASSSGTSKTVPRVSRPGFNAIIVNTRQVVLL